jgi:hypothetical protein
MPTTLSRYRTYIVLAVTPIHRFIATEKAVLSYVTRARLCVVPFTDSHTDLGGIEINKLLKLVLKVLFGCMYCTTSFLHTSTQTMRTAEGATTPRVYLIDIEFLKSNKYIYIIYLLYYYFFAVALRLNSGHDLLIL